MELRQELASIMEERGIGQLLVSRALGMSATVVSQYLAGKYQGDVPEVDRKVRAYLARLADEIKDELFTMPIVQTTTLRRIHEAARICHVRRMMGIAYGPAGIGKTQALREYVAQYPDTFLIETNPGYTMLDLSKVIFKLLTGRSLSGYKMSSSDVIDLCVEKLHDSGRLLIIDEAEELKTPSLNTLRRIYDKANIGILLVGREVLRANLIGKRGELEQLYRRIKVPVKIDGLTEEDTEQILQAALPKYAHLWPEYHKESHGLAWRLEQILERSIRFAKINGCDINKDLIRRTAKDLIV